MLVKDLISLLEKELEHQKKYEEYFGEASISIDLFDVKEGKIVYLGFSPEIQITTSSDGCYRILTAWKTDDRSS